MSWRLASYVSADHRLIAALELISPRIKDRPTAREAGWWESGCLRTTKNVEYLPFGDRPDWSQGFLELHINKGTGEFFCLPHFIINHQTYFNGRLYAA